MSVIVWCDCACHHAPDVPWNPMGVDTRDPIAAHGACSKCQGAHCRTFLDDPPSAHVVTPYSDGYPRPADVVADTDD